ncbi:hypothetical protein THAPS_38111, partial [Thalassiosira pseudonana CCMP1335]
LAGIAGGSASTILLYPLDLVKVRLQVDERRPKTQQHAPPAAAKRVIRTEGYAGLYKGLTPAIIGSAASWGGFFILYEEMKQVMLQRKIKFANAALDTSCLSGACMVALTNPLWLIKTRLQLQNSRLQQQLSQPNGPPLKPPYRGLVHAAFTIVKEEGVLALYKGSVPALMLVSHGGIQFVSYEWLKGHFAAWNRTIGERLRASFGYLVMGATSKFIASTTTYPLQVIKARLQQRSQREYSGVIDCVGKIWRNEGVGGFFKGCVTNALRVAPSAAITFVVYESVLDALTD